MIDGWLRAFTIVVAVGCGASGGVFFAFPAFVMPALGRLPAAQAVAAMQAVNVAAITPSFMAPLLGTALGSAGLAVAALVSWGEDGSVPLLAGSLSYLVGVMMLTVAYHVPRNIALAAVSPRQRRRHPAVDRLPPQLDGWDHLRAVGGLAGAAFLTVALGAG